MLVFSDAKKTVYQLEGSLPEFYATLRGTILPSEGPLPTTRSHTGDLDRDERRNIELAFDRQQIRVLLATQTLEVGVDFQALQLEIQVGATYSYNDYIQRVGRAGRKGVEALVICVLRPQVPLDYYYFEHCRELVQFSPDSLDDIPLRSDNPFIVERHAPAAVQDFIIGAEPGAKLVWKPQEAIQLLQNCTENVEDYLRDVFIKPFSEDADLIQDAISTGVRKCIGAIGSSAERGTLERLKPIVELTIRASDAPVDVLLTDFEMHKGISLAGDIDSDDDDGGAADDGDPSE